ncbi:MAG TPA: hypothetical protein VFP68_23475 [Burkholderiaceae bacterium]|nr:hypothetical protein [Burkholderiaceae bacterium]
MSTKPVPRPLAIRDAIERSEPLAQLMYRLRESKERFEAIAPLIPPALKPHVSPGPVSENGWALLASNASVAAKLRHLLPAIDETLQANGWPATALRVKIAMVA